jgi:ribosome-associated heat shock protein Hsp15
MEVKEEKLRIDKYLWAIRVFKTRSQAADACNSGKVKCKGDNCKPARAVNILDEYDIKTEHRKWIIQVAGLLHTRKAYSEAINFYIDKTPADELAASKPIASSFNTGKRLSKIGRPTKKEKRDLDDFMEQ